MNSTALDPCFFYKRSNSKLQVILVVQVYDTWCKCTKQFAVLQAEKSKQFQCKPRNEDLPFKFNGMWIDSSESNGYFIHQSGYCQSIKISELCKNRKTNTVIDDPIVKKEFLSMRYQFSYASTSAKPDLSLYSAILSQVSEDRLKLKHIEMLRKAILATQEPVDISLPKLDTNSFYISRYANAAFANNSDMT